MIAFRRRAPLFAPVVSSTAVGNTSVVARRPRVTRNSSGSSFQLTWRDTNLERRSRAERSIGARDDAGPRGRIDVPELRGQREDPPVACCLLAPKRRIV